MHITLSTIIALLLFITSLAHADTGIVSLNSTHSVKETLDRLEAMLKEKGLTVFIRINHAEGAKQAGMELRPTEALIFGNPKIGTPFMQCGQTVALDLPQKALAWEDENGQVWLSYNDPQYLADRHSIKECAEVIEKISNALGNFAKAATSSATSRNEGG